MNSKTISDLLAFRDERDWEQFHNPKDLAISLSLETSELLELFQWKDNEEAIAKGRDRMAEELADVCTYAVYFAKALGFDLDEIIEDKLKKNAAKYPVSLAKGSKKKYTELKSDDSK